MLYTGILFDILLAFNSRSHGQTNLLYHFSFFSTLMCSFLLFSRTTSKEGNVRRTRSEYPRKVRKINLRPMVKQLLAAAAEDEEEKAEKEDEGEREDRIFNPSGYEGHLVEILEKDILQRNPDVQWDKVAGLQDAKGVLQEAMVLPMLMPDYFKVNECYIHVFR